MNNYSQIEYYHNGMIVPIEIWKDITNDMVVDVLPYYKISSLGRVYSTNTNKILYTFTGNSGYITVHLQTSNGQKNVSIHRLVMMAFCPINNPENFVVNHITGDKSKNYYMDLEWTDYSGNYNYALENKLNNQIGETHSNAVLSEKEVRFICECLQNNLSYDYIKQKLIEMDCRSNDIHGIIYHIHKRERWNHISKDYTFEYKNQCNKLEDSEIHKICKLLEQKLTMKQILYSLNYDINSMTKKELSQYFSLISSIKNRKSFKQISKDYNF